MTDLRRKRIVYMSDQEWAEVIETSGHLGISASLFVRSRVRTTSGSTPSIADLDRAAQKAGLRPKPDTFGHSSPAPKPGAKK